MGLYCFFRGAAISPSLSVSLSLSLLRLSSATSTTGLEAFVVGDAAEGGVPAGVSTSHGAGGTGKGLVLWLQSDVSRMSFAKKEKGLPASFRDPSSGLTCIE